jgi:hypothetical protein
MGLDFRQSTARWSYGGFNNFRSRLAAEIGIDLDSMQGFGGLGESSTIDPTPPGRIPWSTVDDDLVPLLNHSDCDGVLTAEEMRSVSPRLREIVSHWPTDAAHPASYDRRQALQLCDDMDSLLAECGDAAVLEFC